MSSSFLPSSLLGCSVLIKWRIPSGIYVDPYQLQASVMNKTVRFSSHVNIEQMAHHAEPLTLHSLPSLQCGSTCRFSQSIQFHLRYHLPSSINDYAAASLSSPSTYFSCDCASIDLTAVHKCVWQSLPEHVQIQHILVPIGSLSHSPLVTIVTIAISFIGIASVAWASAVEWTWMLQLKCFYKWCTVLGSIQKDFVYCGRCNSNLYGHKYRFPHFVFHVSLVRGGGKCTLQESWNF